MNPKKKIYMVNTNLLYFYFTYLEFAIIRNNWVIIDTILDSYCQIYDKKGQIYDSNNYISDVQLKINIKTKSKTISI